MSRKRGSSKFNARWTTPSGTHNAKSAADAVGRTMPSLYALLDVRGVVLLETVDSHFAWLQLNAMEAAREKVDAADHRRIFAFLGMSRALRAALREVNGGA